MPAAKRVRTASTADWEALQLRLHWPEQLEYELIRPVVVFGLTPAARAEQTGAAARTIARRAEVFDGAGFAGLLGADAPSQRVPEGIRDALLTLKAEYPAFNPHELLSIAAVRFGRRLSYHTVKRVLDTGPIPTAPPRAYSSTVRVVPSARVMGLVSMRVLFSSRRPSLRRGWSTPAFAAVTRFTGSRPRSGRSV